MGNFNIDQLVDRMYADTAPNNWRKLHGYPLRRKSANRHYKDLKLQKSKSMTFGISGAGRSRYCIRSEEQHV